jgi:sensor histidine kinase YesM
VKKNKLLLLVYLLFCTAIITFAQNAKIEELKLRLNNAKHDTTRVITLYKLGVHFNSLGEYRTALSYINQSIQLGEAIHFASGCAGAYNNAGVSYFYLGNYTEALKNYLKALKYSKEAGNKVVTANTSINIGIIYAIQKEYAKATQYFEIASKVLVEINDTKALGELYANLGSLYAEQGKYNKALNSNTLALKYYNEWGASEGILNTYNNIGSIYKSLGNYSKALQYHTDALKLAAASKDKTGMAASNIMMGEIYNLQNKPADAVFHLKNGLSVAKETGNLSAITDAFRNLSEVNTKEKEYKEALTNYQNYVLFKDSIFNEENTKKIVALQMQFDFDQKEAKTKAQQAIKDAIAKQEIQQQKIIILAVILGSGILLLVLLLLINKRKARHNLEVNKLENKTLRSQLNPHFIFNALASIQKYMNEHPELAENYLAKFGKLMREVLENSEKEYICLEDEFVMIKNYMDLEKLRVKNGFDYEFIIDEKIDVEEIQIPPLLLQPIIENAIWHGVAKGNSKGSILITTTLKDDVVYIEIENKNDTYAANGKASEENIAKRKSFGLQIVKERLALLSKEKRKSSNLEIIPTQYGMKVKILLPF